MEGRRLGRGEALRRLLQSQSETSPGRSAPVLSQSRDSDSSGREAPTPPRPAGRSALFAQLAKEKDERPSSTPDQPQVSRPGRGRALLASLAGPSKEAEIEVAKVTQRIADMPTISESEPRTPIIQKGSYGKEVTLGTNFVKLFIEEGKGLFQYDVKFEPDVDSKNIRFNLIKQVKHVIGEVRLFDGTILYLPMLLSKKVTVLEGFLESDKSKVTITITFTKKRRMGDPEAIHLYNVLFKKIMVVLGLALHGTNFYDPKAAMPIPLHKLEVWPGYVTAIDELEGGVMLCCDASHRVLRNQTVLELMEEIQSSNRAQWKDDFVKIILGQSVLTRYNNRVYRVDDVSFDESPRSTFQKANGDKMRYCDYYRQQYNINLTELDQPLLISKSKMKIKGREHRQMVCLIPELSYLTGISDTMRADMRVMKDITQCICITPTQRHYAITQFIRNVQGSKEASKILSDWGLSLDNSFSHLPGRTMPPLDIIFGGNNKVRGTIEANWTSGANKNSVLTSVDLKNWVVVCTRRDEKMVSQFIDQMTKFSTQLGMRINSPRMSFMNDDRTDNYIRTIRSALSDRQVQLVMSVFPMARSDKYSAVKKLCCIDNPVPSQAMLSRTVRRATTSRAIVLKVALQMNCKLGGTLWSVNIPVESTMVCGLDAYHDAKRKGNSVGAVVSSLNQSLTRWYSQVYTQNPGLEFIDGLEVCMLASLQKYREINGNYPQQIFIYRDGVSDGQLKVCLQYELPQIQKACQRISSEYDPYILLVIVQKRINARIFSFENESYGNPPPGTVMDHTITRRYLYDFFLVSQHVGQGTVSPTHYIVLFNSTKLTPDQVQRFSYALTHLYYNWPGTIRVPAPCQYAHKLAYLVGENIHKEAAEVLQDKLFYL